MGPNRVECVAVLTWTLLLLCLVQGWTEISDSQLRTILEGRYSIDTVKLDAPEKLPIDYKPGDADYVVDEDYDNREDTFYDYKKKSEPYKLLETTAAPTPGPAKEDPTGFNFTCSENAFKISISKKEMDNAKVIGSKELLSIEEAEKLCGYNVNREEGILIVPFTWCFVRTEQTDFSLQLLMVGGSQVRTATCPKQVSGPSPRHSFPSKPGLVCPFMTTNPPTVPPQDVLTPPPQFQLPQFQLPPQFPFPLHPPLTTDPPTQSTIQPPVQPTVQLGQNCAVPTVARITCGVSWVNMQSCKSMGCCWDLVSSSCFYPMDECTKDHYFVFSIYHNSAPIPVDPASLVIPGTNCRPVILTDTIAVFKFKINQCGTRLFTVGGTRVYLAEVQTAVETLNLKYGVISRRSQVRFLIECRYSSSDKTFLASTGYMVKTPSSIVPSVVYSDGLYGVELKLAKDETYSSFYPTYHQPLRLILGKPVYLQLHLLSPTPQAILLVNYCIAYPRSASNALVLVHEGCDNPYDPHTYILKNHDYNGPSHERRFVVKAFQFMEHNTNQYLDEEIYFMCSTEVCFPLEKLCEERCFTTG